MPAPRPRSPSDNCCLGGLKHPAAMAVQPPVPDIDPGVEAANPTGLVHNASGMPVFSVIDDDGAVIELYYHDPVTGAKIVTNTGFSPQTSESTQDSVAYETLASGAVEKLNKYVTLVDGVPQAPVFTQFGSGAAYTPADLTRVEPRPIKMQMGEGTFEVTATAAGFPAIPTVANSEGENFPQHAFVHVNADEDGTGAGIAYTTDGSNPANSATAVEFEISAGSGFELDTWEEINGFRAVAINRKGDDDAAATSVDVSYEFNNISPDKDDV